MATKILAEPAANTQKYRLPTAARLAILAQSDLSRQFAKIERQRLAFVQAFGSDFNSEK
jgi:hypothetical protein